MDNSPKIRRRAAKSGGGFFGLVDREAAINANSRARVMKARKFRDGNTPESLRAGRLAAAIRRLNYKRDEAKGNG